MYEDIKETLPIQSDHEINYILKHKVGNDLILKYNPFSEKDNWKLYTNKSNVIYENAYCCL